MQPCGPRTVCGIYSLALLALDTVTWAVVVIHYQPLTLGCHFLPVVAITKPDDLVMDAIDRVQVFQCHVSQSGLTVAMELPHILTHFSTTQVSHVFRQWELFIYNSIFGIGFAQKESFMGSLFLFCFLFRFLVVCLVIFFPSVVWCSGCQTANDYIINWKITEHKLRQHALDFHETGIASSTVGFYSMSFKLCWNYCVFILSTNRYA